MIVKNNNFYQKLFQEINSALKYSGDDEILHIEDYYTALDEIRDYVIGENGTADNPKNDPYFLIMPVESDETLFEIDANSRNIKIPEAFRLNGVAVQGDDRAEILYFQIDRYFDLTDLYHKEIFILWNPPGKDGRPVSTGTMLSPVINKSLYYKPNYVVFGWPIVKEMTEYAGEMEFSVRFYDRDEKDPTKLNYSFSTKPFRVKIMPCAINDLDISNLELLDAAIIDRNQEIYDSLRRSETEGPEGQAAEPIWDTSYFSPAAETTCHIDELVDGVLKGRAKFGEEEEISKIGLMSYSWSKSDAPKTSTSKNIVKNLLEKSIYEDVTSTETTRNQRDIYYTLDTDGEYVPYAGAIPPAENVQIFKMITSHTPEGPGYYYLTATNKLSRKAQKSITYEDCWHIPKPVTPVIKFTVDGEETKNVIFDKTVTTSKEASVEVTVSDNGEVKVQWQYAANKDDTPIALENSDYKHQIKDYGYYTVVVSNTKNKATNTTVSDPIRVTDFAKPVTVTSFSIGSKSEPASEFASGEIKLLETASTIKIFLDNKLPLYDEISYKWEKKENESWVEVTTITPATEDEILTHEYHIGQTGQYRVTIINNYNTDLNEIVGPTFILM